MTRSWKWSLGVFVPLLLLSAASAIAAERGKSGGLRLMPRDRQASTASPGLFDVRRREQTWDPRQTAIIVCDMWDLHHCKRAVERVVEMAPRMNEVLNKARDQGVLIIHAPSSCMAPYEATPMRKRAKAAPKAANLPQDIANWCTRIPSEEKGKYPVDQSDGGEDDEAMEHAQWAAKLKAMGRNPRAPWKSQIDVLKMDEKDAVSDSGVEIWNMLEERGIKNVILLGVHTNMCVLGRPFGLRQMAKNGKNVVLMRDMTDTMYNPARWPYVNHFRGTDLVVEHIEKFVCPTVTSNQILGDGKPFRFKNDRQARIVVAMSEAEYKTGQTLPPFAKALQDQFGLEPILVHGDPKNGHILPGLADALGKGDLLLLSVKRRALPPKDMEAVHKFLEAGKPVVGIRTANHAFYPRGDGPKGHVDWQKFDQEVLGGNYTGHHGVGPKTVAKIAPGAENHPVVSGISAPFNGHGSLYQVSPLASSTKALLIGSIPDKPAEPIAWVNRYGKAPVFYTSLGHPGDFREPAFVRLLSNAILWGLDPR